MVQEVYHIRRSSRSKHAWHGMAQQAVRFSHQLSDPASQPASQPMNILQAYSHLSSRKATIYVLFATSVITGGEKVRE